MYARTHLAKRPEPSPAETCRSPQPEAHHLCRKSHLSLLVPTPEAIRAQRRVLRARSRARSKSYPGLRGRLPECMPPVGCGPGDLSGKRRDGSGKKPGRKGLTTGWALGTEARAAHALALAVHDWNFQAADKEFHACPGSPSPGTGIQGTTTGTPSVACFRLGLVDRTILELKVALEFASRAAGALPNRPRLGSLSQPPIRRGTRLLPRRARRCSRVLPCPLGDGADSRIAKQVG